MKGIFMLRGETFRGSIENQIKCYESIVENVIKPSKLMDRDITVFVVTYNNEKNKLIRPIFKNYQYKLIIHEKFNQVSNFKHCINSIPEPMLNNCNFCIILRSDLFFKKAIDYQRVSQDKILFQWNLFHNSATKEYADQIHCIGGNLINKFKQKINNNGIDYNWKGTLHNLYNFCLIHFGKEKLSYLNYIPNPNPNVKYCPIRGNPSKNKGNPLYTYLRFM